MLACTAFLASAAAIHALRAFFSRGSHDVCMEVQAYRGTPFARRLREAAELF
jgi:hypothetical protein